MHLFSSYTLHVQEQLEIVVNCNWTVFKLCTDSRKIEMVLNKGLALYLKNLKLCFIVVELIQTSISFE